MVLIYTLSDLDGKIRYVGKTKLYLKQRLYSHILESKNSTTYTHKKNWIKSLLEKDERPIIDVIDEVPESEWPLWEQYWIDQIKSWGFNLTNSTEGGQGGNGYKHSDSSKQKMSESKLGKELPESHRKNIGLALKEGYKKEDFRPNRFDKKVILYRDELYQKYIVENFSIPKCSDYFKCSETSIFRNLKEYGIEKDKSIWIKQLATNQKKVLQYNLDGSFIREWNSTKEVIKELNLYISNCCSGRKKTCGGFIWRYKDEWFDLRLDKLNENLKKITQYDLDGNWIRDFDSMIQASDITGIDDGNIGECCRKKYKSAGKYIWRYYGDTPPKKYTNKTLKSVSQYDLKGNLINEFDSIAEAAKQTGGRSNCIQMCCVGKYNHSNGFIWKYKNNI
jgi:hypothetical protein